MIILILCWVDAIVLDFIRLVTFPCTRSTPAPYDLICSICSYYGQTLLYFITAKGESNQIVLNKNGPVYDVQWNPQKDEFIVLYGFMPSR